MPTNISITLWIADCQDCIWTRRGDYPGVEISLTRLGRQHHQKYKHNVTLTRSGSLVTSWTVHATIEEPGTIPF